MIKKTNDMNLKNQKKFSKDYQPPEKWTEKIALELGGDLITWLNELDEFGNDKGNMFFQEFLIIEKNLHPNMIGYLCKKFKSFSELIEKAKKIQEIKLVKHGVGDRLNPTMTKFVLMNHHDYSDKTKNDVTVKEQPLFGDDDLDENE